MDLEHPALRCCVGDPASFIEERWGREPFLWRGKPGDLADLASLETFDRLIVGQNLRVPSFRMVKDGEPVPTGRYTRRSGGRKRTTDAVVAPGGMYEQFQEGATIVLEGLHKQWPPLARFCRDLELTLGHPFQVNAYVTPTGAQGFARHVDDHDVFVLQVHGTKSWSVWGRDAADDAEPLIQDDVSEGDCLYIPEGFPHSARTGSSSSAHLTVGALTRTRADLMEALLELAPDEVGSARLSPAAARDPEALTDEVRAAVTELRAWLERVAVSDLVPALARRFMTSKQQIPHGWLEQIVKVGTLDDGTEIRRKPGISFRLIDTADAVVLLSDDRELTFPAWVRPALEAITERPMPVRDLAPFLDAGSRAVLCRRLVEEGLLVASFDDD